MTSDAKIGLLLGLVFIFVIAFIINGLPLRPQASEAKVTTELLDEIRQDPVGVDGPARRGQEQLDSRAEVAIEPLDESLFESSSELPPALAAEPHTAESPGEAEQDVRFSIELPSRETVRRVTRGVENIINTLAQASERTLVEETGTEPAPTVAMSTETPSPASPESPSRAKPASTPVERAGAIPKAYVVVDGDSLAAIAKKVYGPEEGNRVINVKRLYEANRQLLTSPDEVKIGQKLRVPAPAPPAPASVLPAEQFEQVRQISRRQVQATRADQPEGRWYVVQENDSLWKIAETQLGSGVRHEEIAKLNTDILEDPTLLKVGMRLRLPAK
jgi:nucleoid-associated protein YgaU